MAKISELFKSLAKKAGIDITGDEYKPVLELTAEVPDALNSALETNLMSEAAALNNSKIKATLKAQIYNGIDSDVNALIEEYELEDSVKTAILSEKKSVDRIKKLASHLKEQSTKASKEGNKPEADALRRQVQDLNEKIKTVTADKQKEIDQLKADNENASTGFDVKALLSSKEFTLPKEIAKGEQLKMIHGIVTEELKTKGLKLVRENGLLKLTKEDGSEPFDDKNNKLELSSFIDGALSQRGLLKITDSNGPGGNGNNPPANVGPDGKAIVPLAGFNSAISEIEARIAEATKA